MPLTAVLLVLVAGLIHASWNVAAKRASGDARFACFSGLVLMLFWAPVGLWFAWQELPSWRAREWGFVVLTGVLHWIYYVTLLRGYRKADLTVVYPLARGSAPLMSSIGAFILLGEQISRFGIAGIFGVVVGVFLIAGGPKLIRRAAQPDTDQHAAMRLRKGLMYGLLTGVFIASYTVVDGYAVKVLLMSPVLVDYMGNFVRVALLLPPVFRDLPTAKIMWRAQWKYAVLVGIISPVSYVMVLYAVQLAPLSHVAPAREVSMLFAAFLGGRLLGEGERWMRMAGAVLIAIGVMALAWG